MSNRVVCGVAAVPCFALSIAFLLFYARTRSLTGAPESAAAAIGLARDWPTARLLWILAVLAAVVASIWTGVSLARGRIGKANLTFLCCPVAAAMVAASLWISPAKFYTMRSSFVPDLKPGDHYLTAGMLAAGATLLLLGAAVALRPSPTP